MKMPEIQIASDCVAQARGLYDEPIPADDADELIGSSTDLARHLEWMQKPHHMPHHSIGDELMREAAEAASVMDEGQAAYTANSPETQRALAARLHESVERGLAAVDRVLAKIDPANESGVERSARTLAVIARTLREIAAITQPQKLPIDHEAEDDPIPRDIDDFRRELTRRVQNFIDDEQSGIDETPP